MSARDHDRLTPLGIAVVLGTACFLPVQALAGWNLYQNYSTSYYIPFVPNQAISAPPDYNAAKTGMFVSTSIAGSQPVTLQIDTGSQGVVIPQYLIPGFVQAPVDQQQKIAYSTSGNYAYGTWSTQTITFTGSSDGNGNVATATLPVFVAATAVNGSASPAGGYNCAVQSSGQNCFFMMGVGFGRPDGGWGPNYLPSLANNALLNIDGMAQGTVRAGYILTPTGIEAGLTAQNTAGNFAYLKLMQETIAGQAGVQWATAPGSVTIANQNGTVAQYGTMILMDTGITHFYGSTGTTYSNASTYNFTIGLLGGTGVAGYTFSATGSAVNAASTGNPTYLCGSPGPSCGYTPSYFEGNGSSIPEMLNVGIHSMAGFNYLFDAVDGYLGLAENGNASGGWVNPTLVTQGPIGFSTALSTNLPVFVYGATSISATSTADFTGPVQGVAALTLAGGTITLSGGVDLPAGLFVTGGNVNLQNTVAAPLTTSAGTSVTNAGTLAGAVVNAGTFQNDAGATVAAAFTNTGTLQNSGTIAGSLGTSGAVTNAGAVSGMVVNTGTFENTGTIGGGVANGGSFSNDGTVTGGFLNQGLLNGNGTIVGNLVNAGIVAPGHSIGTVNVQGNVAFQPGSVYFAEIGANGASDQINATGTATIANGTTLVVAPYGGYTPGLGTYTILTAAGGISGTFTSVVAPNFGTAASAYPFLTVQPTLVGGALELAMVRGGVAFSAAGQTANEAAAGYGLDGMSGVNPLLNAAVGLNLATAPAALDTLTGEVYASVESILLDQSSAVRNGVLGRLRQAFDAPGAGGVDAAKTATPISGLPFTLWGAGYGAWGQANSTANAAGDDRSLTGFLTGFDYAFAPAWRAGLAAGYSRSDFNVDGRTSAGDSDNYDIALYGGGTLAKLGPGVLALRAGAAYAWHDLSVDRTAAVGSFTDSLSSGYKGSTAQVFAELGYGIDLGKTPVGKGSLGATRIEPFASLSYTDVSTDSFTETGGAAALAVNGGGFDSTASQLGLRASTLLPVLPNGAALDLHGMLGWQYAFGDTTPTIGAAFAAGSPTFAVSGAPIARNALLLGAGIDAVLNDKVTFGISYAGQLASTTQDNAFQGTLSIKF